MTPRVEWWASALCLLLVLAVYAPGFSGFWLGDDFSNLHNVFVFDREERLLSGTLAYFGKPISEGGSMYRPLSIASFAADFALFGDRYPGWYGINVSVHLLNVLLVMLLVRRLAQLCDLRAPTAATLAGALFGLAPAVAEGVFWISARADAWVTLLGLLGTWCWLSADERGAWRAALLPALLVVAVLFKESAAVLPLQVTLLALAMPRRLSNAQRVALLMGFVILGAFLGLRWWLFDSAWRVYTPPNPELTSLSVAGVEHALRSFGPWWHALSAATPLGAAIYLLAIATLLAWCVAFVRGQPARFALAALGASGGMLLAATINVAGMPLGGDGGRWTYTPLAWLSLGIGAALAARPSTEHARGPALAVALIGALCGTWVLIAVLHQARQAQDQVRALVNAIPAWAQDHPGLTMLLMSHRSGIVATTMNAHAGLTLLPVQTEGWLHRVLPTHIDDLAVRRQQFTQGLASRLREVRPQWIDAANARELARPGPIGWPDHYACWSNEQARILPLAPPRTDDPERWPGDIVEQAAQRCRI